MRLASTRSRYFSRWRRHAPPLPPSCPWAGMQGSRSRDTQGSHKLLGGVEEVERGVGNAIPRERGKGSKIQIKRYMYPRNEPFLSLGAWGRTHRGGVLETEEWEDSIRRRATGLGQGAMAQEPSLRWCVLTGTNVSAPLSSVCGPGSFPFGDFLNADWESRAAQCRRALERGKEDGEDGSV